MTAPDPHPGDAGRHGLAPPAAVVEDALRAAADRCQAAIAAAADSSDPHATRRLIEACANARDAIDDVLHLAAGTSRRGQVG